MRPWEWHRFLVGLPKWRSRCNCVYVNGMPTSMPLNCSSQTYSAVSSSCSRHSLLLMAPPHFFSLYSQHSILQPHGSHSLGFIFYHLDRIMSIPKFSLNQIILVLNIISNEQPIQCSFFLKKKKKNLKNVEDVAIGDIRIHENTTNILFL